MLILLYFFLCFIKALADFNLNDQFLTLAKIFYLSSIFIILILYAFIIIFVWVFKVY